MIAWLIDTTLTTGALIALVLLLRRPVGRMFGPGMAYALWALPLVRLLLPPLKLPASFAPKSLPVAVEGSTQVILAGPVPAGEVATASAAIPIEVIIMALWLAGALTFLAWRTHAYLTMRRMLLADARPMGSADKVRIVETPAVDAPVAFGIFDKVVALPIGFMARRDRIGRDLAIAHELEHHAGHDLAANLAVQPLLALHWFNPLAWIGWRAMRRDQEAACDARVMAGCDPALRASYGRLIASFAGGPRLALASPMACPVLGEKSIIHRLRNLTMSEPSPRRRLMGRALIGAALLALPATASITYAEEPAPSSAPAPKVQKRIVIVEQGAPGVPEEKLHVRTVQRGDKTVVIKTDRELSDAELDARLARLDSELPPIPPLPDAGMAPPAPPAPPAPGAAPMPAASPMHRERQVIIMTKDGAGGEEVKIRGTGRTCPDGSEARNIEQTVDANGKRQVVRLKLCGDPADAPARALEGLRHARDRIAQDRNMSPEIRDRVLSDIDAEIDKLAKQQG